MEGIVSLLDDRHNERVQTLWDELEHEFGLRSIYATRFPHFSYHVAESYQTERLRPILARFAQGHLPCRVRTTGLGIFTGAQPVLYVPVVRSPDLSRLHQELWWAVAGTVNGTIELYHPLIWVPHITLAHGDLRPEALPDVIRYLQRHTFNWEFPVTNLVLVTAAGTPAEKQYRYTLGGDVPPQVPGD